MMQTERNEIFLPFQIDPRARAMGAVYLLARTKIPREHILSSEWGGKLCVKTGSDLDE